MINDLLMAIDEAELTQTFYYAFFVIGFLVTYAFLIWYRKKIGLKVLKTIIATIIGSVLVLCVMGLLQFALRPLENVIPIMNSYLNNMGRGFIFVPLIALITARILKLPWEIVSNLYVFTQTIIWGFASLGCLFAGCCTGYPCEWGIYNTWTEIRVFPTQILNSIGLLSVAIYIFIRCKNKNYLPDGKEYPIMLILVGTIRFLTEFLMDNSKIIFGLSSLSFDSLVMIMVGTVLLVIIDKKNQKTELELANFKEH